MRTLRTAWVVFRKELIDALRDRRTLAVLLVSSVLLGPVLLLVLSQVIAGLEARAERREVVVQGIEHAPALKNFIERQTYTVLAAPAGHEALLKRSALRDPVLVIPKNFEADLLEGEQPTVEVVFDSGNRDSQSAVGWVQQLVNGYARERGLLSLALRGVSPQVMEPLRIDEHDLASDQSRGTQLTSILPFFVIMAMLSAAINAALDTTAGERERSSLEPLLMNPADRIALVVGKWAAVASLGMLIAVLNSLSFIPAQWFLRSDNLQAMFQFGLHEVGQFLAVLLPLAAALSAMLMAVAIRCRTYKEAQANSTVVVLGVSLTPLVTLFNPASDAPWLLWVPALAQSTLMGRVLKGEDFGAAQVLVPLFVCAVLTVASLVFVTRRLRSAAVK
jgi:sodium transport system permease protein